MKETIAVSCVMLIEFTFLMTASGHEATNPLTDSASSPHHHHQQQHQQQQHPAVQHHQSHGINRNTVQDRQ